MGTSTFKQNVSSSGMKDADNIGIFSNFTRNLRIRSMKQALFYIYIYIR